MSEVIIKASGAELKYPPPHGLTVKGMFARKDINRTPNLGPFTLNVSSGQRIAVIGKNGAGKTSFLRLIAGIYPPSSGQIIINAKINAVIDSGLGFDPFASARDNIKMRCRLDGITSREEINSVVCEVEEFVELRNKFDEPIYTYSTGMFFRVAFAYATRKAKSIAVIDELIGSGDLSFAQKAEKRLNDFLNSSSTLIMSSHSMELIRQYCNSCIYIVDGQLQFYSNIEQGIEEYKSDASQ